MCVETSIGKGQAECLTLDQQAVPKHEQRNANQRFLKSQKSKAHIIWMFLVNTILTFLTYRS